MANKNTSTFLQGMIVGIIIGVLIAVLMIFITRDSSSQHATATLEKDASKKKQTPSVAQNTPGVTPPQTPDTTASAQQDSQYDFYKILPADSADQKQSEPITGADTSPATSGTTSSPDKEKTPSQQEMANLAPAKPLPSKIPQKETPMPAGYYWIQTGAFRSRSDAERTKARLALLGLEAKITSSDGWYRVRVGPLDNNQAAKTKAKITQNGMEAHLIKEN